MHKLKNIRKHIFSATFLTFCGCFALAQDAKASISAGAELSLDDCIAIALSENPTVKVANLEIERLDYSKKETLANLLPQASFDGNYNRMLAKQVMYMNMDFDFSNLFPGGGGAEGGESPLPDAPEESKEGGNDGIKVGLDNSYQVGFSASMPLIAPQLWASLKLSDSQIAQAVEQARASKLDLVNQVKGAYYALQLAYDSRQVIQESYDMAKLTYQIYQKQFEAGAASDYDVLRTSVAMKNIEPQIIQADIAIRRAKLQLAILMGLNTDFDFSIKGSIKDYQEDMYAETLSINPDYSENSQLILNEIQLQQVNQNIKLQKAAFLPTLAAMASYNWTSMSNGSPFKNFRWNPYSVVGLSLNFPLFTGGSRYSKVKQAKVQAIELEFQRENLERTVSMQVDLAIDNIKMNVQQIASCSESVQQAERAHDIMEKSFAIGAASYLDLRDSELSLTQARLSHLQAIYNYLVAQSELQLLLGKM